MVMLGNGNPGNMFWLGSMKGDQIELHSSQNTRCTAVLRPFVASSQPVVQLEHPSRLIGSWEGQWDGQWSVRFTITTADIGYMIHYEWQAFEGGPSVQKLTWRIPPQRTPSRQVPELSILLPRTMIRSERPPSAPSSRNVLHV